MTAPGSLDAFQQVQITARVAGAVDKVGVRRGTDRSSRATCSSTIETDRYQVAVDQAKAALDKAAADGEGRRGGARAAPGGGRRRTPAWSPARRSRRTQTNVATTKADVAAAQQNAARRAAQPARRLRARAVRRRHPVAHRADRPVPAARGRARARSLQRDPLLLRFGVTEQDAPRLKAGDDGEHQAARERAHVHGEDHPRRRGGRPHDAPRARDRRGRRHRRTSTGCGPARSARSPSPSATRAPRSSCRRSPVQPTDDGQRRLHGRRQERRAPEERAARDVHARRRRRGHARASRAGDLLVVEGFEAADRGRARQHQVAHDASRPSEAGRRAPRRHAVGVVARRPAGARHGSRARRPAARRRPPREPRREPHRHLPAATRSSPGC